MSALHWPTDGPLAEVRPATDLVLLSLRQAAAEARDHDHPQGEDIFCLNMTSWMGERMAGVLKRLADAEAEVQSWKDRCTALADEALRQHDEDERETYAQAELDQDRNPTAEGFAEWKARRLLVDEQPPADVQVNRCGCTEFIADATCRTHGLLAALVLTFADDRVEDLADAGTHTLLVDPSGETTVERITR
jgi:hypothetical protein